MTKKMDKDEYISKMVERLPVMRISIGLTQAQLGEKLDVSRQTVVAIENRKRELSWSLYLAMVCVFMQYEEANMLLDMFKLFSPDVVRDM